jgi:hypothetical protein
MMVPGESWRQHAPSLSINSRAATLSGIISVGPSFARSDHLSDSPLLSCAELQTLKEPMSNTEGISSPIWTVAFDGVSIAIG